MELKTQGNEVVRGLSVQAQENDHSRHPIRRHDGMTITVTEGEYNGYPTLTFEGPFRRFTLGMKKLRALKQVWPEVESFLQRHAKGKSGQPRTNLRRHAQKESGQGFTDDDDVKISRCRL
jgi:hypothetical protein